MVSAFGSIMPKYLIFNNTYSVLNRYKIFIKKVVIWNYNALKI